MHISGYGLLELFSGPKIEQEIRRGDEAEGERVCLCVCQSLYLCIAHTHIHTHTHTCE